MEKFHQFLELYIVLYLIHTPENSSKLRGFIKILNRQARG